MLYTVVPIEDVLATDWQPPVYNEVTLSGRHLVYQVDPDGTPRLVRLMSTDPMDYLDPRLQPGASLGGLLPQ